MQRCLGKGQNNNQNIEEEWENLVSVVQRATQKLLHLKKCQNEDMKINGGVKRLHERN